MKPILLLGCGGHARSLIDLIETQGRWRIHGLVGLPEQVGSTSIGYPVIGTDADLPSLRSDFPSAVLAIGQLQDPKPRHRLAAVLHELKFHCPVLISPHATVSRHARVGAGTVVGHGAIVNAGAVLGAHCIINSRALIEHDVRIHSFCHISTGALINGGVKIGRNSFIGSGTIIRERLTLPEGSIISAGKRIMGWPEISTSE